MHVRSWPWTVTVLSCLGAFVAIGCGGGGHHSFTTTTPQTPVAQTTPVTSSTFLRLAGLPGTGIPNVGDGAAAIDAVLEVPYAITRGLDGSYYIADNTRSTFRHFTVGGVIDVVAGTGETPLSGLQGEGGPATRAEIPNPVGVAMDANGVLFLAQYQSAVMTVWGVNPVDTTIMRVAGGGNSPNHDPNVAVDTSAGVSDGFIALPGNVLIWSERARDTVRRLRYDFDPTTGVITNGLIDTICGSGQEGTVPDGTPATQAKLFFPRGVAYAANLGRVFVADASNHKVVSFELPNPRGAPGLFYTVAGTGVGGSSGDGGLATSAQLDSPWGLAYDDASGFVYVSDFTENRLRRFKLGGAITTVAGNGGGAEDGLGGTATNANVSNPAGLCMGPNGQVMICATGVRRILAYTPQDPVTGLGILTPVAGKTSISDTPDTVVARLNDVTQMRLAYANSIDYANPKRPVTSKIFVCDSLENTIRSIDLATGRSTRIAGTGRAESTGSGGPAINASIAPIPLKFDIVADALGNVYVAELESKIRRIDNQTGLIEDFAGTGVHNSTGDGGQAKQATFNGINSMSYSVASGALYVAEKQGDRIRRIGADGVVTTVGGGLPPTAPDPTDGQYATRVSLSRPTAVYVDPKDETIYVALNTKHYVLKYPLGGQITGVAGVYAQSGYNGDGIDARTALLNNPFGVFVDPTGGVVITDQLNLRIRRVDPRTGFIQTVAGGLRGRSADGVALNKVQFRLMDQAIGDPAGWIYVPDPKNQAVFKFKP